nr:hypothetical protein [Moorena sp. SIO3H5]
MRYTLFFPSSHFPSPPGSSLLPVPCSLWYNTLSHQDVQSLCPQRIFPIDTIER